MHTFIEIPQLGGFDLRREKADLIDHKLRKCRRIDLFREGKYERTGPFCLAF